MFSGLDAMTARSCFDTLIEQWHSLADQIFVLGNGGRMKASERLESFKRSSPDNIEAVKVGTDFEERAEQDSQHESGHGKIERAVKILSKSLAGIHNQDHSGITCRSWAPLSYSFLGFSLYCISVPTPYNNLGRWVGVFTGDLNLVDLGLPLSFLLTSEKIALVIPEVVLTCIASGYLAIAIPFLAGILYLVQRVYLRSSRQLRILELELKAPLFSNFLSTYSGLTTIRAFSWMSNMESQNMTLLDISQRPYYLLFCLQRWLTLVLDLCTAGLATLLMALAVILRDKLDPGYLGVALVSVMNFGQIVSALITNWTNLETSLGSVDRISHYLNDAPSEDTNRDDGFTSLQTNWISGGEVAMENVIAYHGNQLVLNDINLVFRAGTKTAICGRTGSGKSTLLGLILRISEYGSGVITIDGVDVSSISPDLVRNAVVGLPQDGLFLDGTVRYNLDPFKKHLDDDQPLLVVLAKIGLTDLFESRGGLHAELDVDWLSAGQRQLFCLARAMLRKSKVLLMDESTSNLDQETEKLVNKLITDEFEDWTVVAVTHRPESVAALESGFDMVVVLENGRAVEVDTPGRLLAKDDGTFCKLVKLRHAS
ncbi:uncharacterized protein RAG0_16297 [Rhynchosporium agropyri]|uniref:Uncharacterized protein n=1 Tax=Rhynchosporium agropyri TaxID=914238 RepID=A0A1E1LPR2_9HELO|nr:uncharacterized protein RAG0_16297 [Rhynchosporium agropyri]